MICHRVTFAARFTATDPAEPAHPLLLTGMVVPWGKAAPLNAYGDTVEFARGSVAPGDPSRVKLLLDHGPEPFGYGVAFEDLPDGLHATFAIPRAELADANVGRAVRQMGNGVRDALSGGFDLIAYDETDGATGAHYTVTAAALFECSSVVVPRFGDARHAPLAASATPPDEDEDEETDDDTDEDEETDATEGETMPTATTDRDEDARVAAHRAATGAATLAPPAQRFASFGAFIADAAAARMRNDYRVGHAMGALRGALADAVTADVPGLIHEVWLGRLVDLMASVSATLDAFSSAPLPGSGNAVSLPYMAQYPDVGLVTGEKVDIPTRKVLVPDITFNVETFAGGQDVSLQTIERSSPAYLDILMTAFAKQMATETNAWFAHAVFTGATAGPAWPADATTANAVFVTAVAQVLAATFSWPDVAVLSVGAWQALAGAVDTDGRPIFPTVSPINPVGSVSLRSGDGTVRDLPFRVDPTVAGNVAVVGMRDAALSLLGPVGTLGADVPSILGRDVAVYRFAAGGVTDPRGIVRIGAAPATAAAAAGSTTAKKSA